MTVVRKTRATRGFVSAAAASYLTNVAFGTGVAVGVIDNSRIRWVHHALFVVTLALTASAIALSTVERRPAGLALLPALVPLAALPYAGGRLARHATVAGAAAPSFAAALILSWRLR